MNKSVIAACVAASVLAACGGSDHRADPAPTSEVPASASQSVDGFIGYLELLVASAAGMLEPVDTGSVVAPTDEAGEPQTVD